MRSAVCSRAEGCVKRRGQKQSRTYAIDTPHSMWHAKTITSHFLSSRARMRAAHTSSSCVCTALSPPCAHLLQRSPVQSTCCIRPGTRSDLNACGSAPALCGICKSPMSSTSTIFPLLLHAHTHPLSLSLCVCEYHLHESSLPGGDGASSPRGSASWS